LSGSISYLEDCTDPAQCFGGFGVVFATTGGETGAQPTVYAAGAYGDHNSSNFDRVGVYGTTPGPPGTSQYLGSYDQQPVPGGTFTNVGQLAASPCHAAIYEIVNVFGGPNGTFNDQFVQQFDTHAAPTCTSSTTTTTRPSPLGVR